MIAAPIYGRHEKATVALAAAPAAAFALLDDHRRLSSHMESSSMMMAGERESAMRMRALATGAAASAVLFALYFLLVGLVSGARYAVEQFATYWYFLVALAVGFGIQMGLYTYLKNLVAHSAASRKVVAVSGTTSTAAMVSCCAHYLANIVPVLGVTGLVTFAIQYQVELFWAGLAFNLAGVAYILRKVMQANKEHAQCAIPA